MRHVIAILIGAMVCSIVGMLLLGPDVLGFVVILLVVCTAGFGLIPLVLVNWAVGLLVLSIVNPRPRQPEPVTHQR